MDTIELEGTTDMYRLVPKGGRILAPIKINATEKSKKLVKVKVKQLLKVEKHKLDFMMEEL